MVQTQFPSIRFRAGLERDEISYIAKNVNLTWMQVVSRINQMLHYILGEVKVLLTQWINTHVPKRTGQLRDKLLQSLEQSYVKYGMLKIITGTRLEYATKVSGMSTGNVRHVATWYEHSGRPAYAYYYGHHGRIFLNDPFAIGGWIEEMERFIKDKSTLILSRAIDLFFGGSGKLGSYIRRKNA